MSLDDGIDTLSVVHLADEIRVKSCTLLEIDLSLCKNGMDLLYSVYYRLYTVQCIVFWIHSSFIMGSSPTHKSDDDDDRIDVTHRPCGLHVGMRPVQVSSPGTRLFECQNPLEIPKLIHRLTSVHPRLFD